MVREEDLEMTNTYDLFVHVRKQAEACQRDGYIGTGSMLRDLANQLEDAQSALRYIEQTYGRLYGVGWDRVLPRRPRTATS